MTDTQRSGIVEADALADAVHDAAARGLPAYGGAFLEFLGAHPELGRLNAVLLYRTLGPVLPDGAASAAILWGAAQQCALAIGPSVERAGIHGEGTALGDALFEAILASPHGLTFTVDEYDESWRRVHGGSGVSFGVIEALRASRPEETLELAHRLDRDTSGLLLVARTRPALRILHELLREGQIEKRYLTLVKGSWDLGTKLIDAPLLTHTRSGGERTVRVAPNGKESSTTFAPVDFFGARATLLDVTLGTGRTHQIRVHAAYTGHPVSGDDKYGDREHNAAMRELGLQRLFLHSQSLSFEWPGSRKNYAFSLPLPPDLASVLENLAATRRKRSRRR